MSNLKKLTDITNYKSIFLSNKCDPERIEYCFNIFQYIKQFIDPLLYKYAILALYDLNTFLRECRTIDLLNIINNQHIDNLNNFPSIYSQTLSKVLTILISKKEYFHDLPCFELKLLCKNLIESIQYYKHILLSTFITVRLDNKTNNLLDLIDLIERVSSYYTYLNQISNSYIIISPVVL